MNGNIICILAKCPRPGIVKTLLEQHLGLKQAAHLARAFMLDTIATALKVQRSDTFIAYCPEEAANEFEDIIFLFQNEEKDRRVASKSKTITLIPQMGHTLGERLSRLSQLFFEERGFKRVLFLCSDVPLLEKSILKAAFELLKSHQVVVGPTFDGGYYLLGVSQNCTDIFKGIDWSGGEIYRQITEKLTADRVRWLELELSYDVDRPEELEQLYDDIENLRLTGKDDLCYHTEKYLANLKR
jgi:hypothetical protein